MTAFAVYTAAGITARRDCTLMIFAVEAIAAAEAARIVGARVVAVTIDQREDNAHA